MTPHIHVPVHVFITSHTHTSYLYVTHQRQLFFEQLDLPLVAGSDGLVVVDDKAETVDNSGDVTRRSPPIR